jgi:hypothetical protein
MAVPLIQATIPVTDEPIASLMTNSSLDDKHNSIHSTNSSPSEESLILKTNPFLDPRVAAHWKEVYDGCRYECRHVFDPTLQWTEEEEKKIIRKVDWRVCLWAVRFTHLCVHFHSACAFRLIL